MQNNGIFGVNLLLFPVKTKTEIKDSPRVIQSVPQRCLLGCGSSMSKQICLSQGLTSPSSIQRVEAWLKHKRTLQTLIWSWPQGLRHVTTRHPPSGICSLWAGRVLSGTGPPCPQLAVLTCQGQRGWIKKMIFCAYCVIALRVSQVFSHLTFTITLWGRYYCYPGFVDEETEAQRINLP